MSKAAEDYVTGCTHPQVKGGMRDLLEAIARRIPEGQTTTALITIDDLAEDARLHRRTVWSRLEDLVDIGLVQVIDGGRGRIGRYQITPLSGARPMIDAPLPLVGAAKPPRLPPRTPPNATPSLFEAAPPPPTPLGGEQRAINVGRLILRLIVNVGCLILRWPSNVGRKILRWPNVGRKILRWTQRRAKDPTFGSPLDVDSRAREYVHTQEVHTHTASRDGPPPSGGPRPPPCRFAGGAHAWCDGRVHVPTDLHREFVRKLGRLAGETDADVDTKLFAFYARRCASLLPQQPIVENDFRFWRRSYAEAFSPATAARAAPLRMVAPPAADIWARVLERLEPKVSRHTFYTWFRDTRLVDDRGDVIEVTRPGSHSELVAGWIPKHYSEVVHQAMEEIRPGTRVTFVVDSGARQRKSG